MYTFSKNKDTNTVDEENLTTASDCVAGQYSYTSYRTEGAAENTSVPSDTKDLSSLMS